MSTTGERFYDEPDAEALQAENERLREELAAAKAAVAVPAARVVGAPNPAEVASRPHRAAAIASTTYEEFMGHAREAEEASRRALNPEPVRRDPTPAERNAVLMAGSEEEFWERARAAGLVSGDGQTAARGAW